MNNILDAKIDVLGLSRRAHSALKWRLKLGSRLNVNEYDPVDTVRQALALTESELNCLPNFGEVSKRELKEKLAAYLAGNSPRGSPLKLREVVMTDRGDAEVVFIGNGQACLQYPDGRLSVLMISRLKRPSREPIIQ